MTVATLLVAVPPAHAATVTYSGFTNFSSPFITIRSCFDSLPTSNRFPAHAQSFSVDTTGSYVLTNISNTYTDTATHTFPTGIRLLLYQDSFDPASDETNCIDDTHNEAQIPPPPTSITHTLTAGTTYICVTTAYAAFDSSPNTFQNSISGPGNITGPGLPPLPTVTPLTDADEDSDEHADADANPDPDEDANPDPDADANPDPDPDANPDRNADTNPDHNADANGNPHPDSHRNADFSPK